MFNLSLRFSSVLCSRFLRQLGNRTGGFNRDEVLLCILDRFLEGLFVPPPLAGFLSDFLEFLFVLYHFTFVSSHYTCANNTTSNTETAALYWIRNIEREVSDITKGAFKPRVNRNVLRKSHWLKHSTVGRRVNKQPVYWTTRALNLPEDPPTIYTF